MVDLESGCQTGSVVPGGGINGLDETLRSSLDDLVATAAVGPRWFIARGDGLTG